MPKVIIIQKYSVLKSTNSLSIMIHNSEHSSEIKKYEV